jgi:hypothetical protein
LAKIILNIGRIEATAGTEAAARWVRAVALGSVPWRWDARVSEDGCSAQLGQHTRLDGMPFTDPSSLRELTGWETVGDPLPVSVSVPLALEWLGRRELKGAKAAVLHTGRKSEFRPRHDVTFDSFLTLAPEEVRDLLSSPVESITLLPDPQPADSLRAKFVITMQNGRCIIGAQGPGVAIASHRFSDLSPPARLDESSLLALWLHREAVNFQNESGNPLNHDLTSGHRWVPSYDLRALAETERRRAIAAIARFVLMDCKASREALSLSMNGPAPQDYGMTVEYVCAHLTREGLREDVFQAMGAMRHIDKEIGAGA